MARRRTRIARKLRAELTGAQEAELLRGCGLPTRAFESETERKRGWVEHREELLSRGRAGSRPSAYWHYDHPETAEARRHDVSGHRVEGGSFVHQVEVLIAIGEATAADVEQLREELDFYRTESGQALCRYAPSDLLRMRAALQHATA